VRIHGVLAFAVTLIGAAGFAQTANPVDLATVHYLQTLRNPDGGYASAAAKSGDSARSSLRATLGTVRALHYLGTSPDDLPATLGFVERCKDMMTGGFADFPGDTPSAISTAIGTMAAVELKVPPELYRARAIKYLEGHTKSVDEIRIVAAAFESLQLRPAKADDWLRQIAATRNANGAFGSGPGLARTTGGTAVMILRLGGKLDDRDAVLKAIRDGQRPDGGFGSPDRDGSDLESIYRVMRAFAMLKEKPADPAKLRAFIAGCRHEGGGYGAIPGQPPTATDTYFAAIILHWLAER
jgi:hypothetical protein